AGSCPDDSVLSDESLPSEEALRVSEYAEDIHRHMREREVWFRPRPGFLENHPEITADMRAVLVSWMVEVVREYRLRSETLHLSVNYLDRFLSQTKSVRRNRLQLVGTAALSIAAKYEEINPPELDDFVYTTDNTYTRSQLMHMELLILKALGYRLAAPTSSQFLSLFTAIQSACPLTHNLAMYIAELGLLETDVLLRYPPSLLAAAAYSLASFTVSTLLWPDNLHAFTGLKMADVSACVADLHQLHLSAQSHPHQAIRERYKSSRYCHVSSITPSSVLPFT
uniref:G2/mitotic-specific cyclin-B2 n=1 Tax=Tetraodon nigroviridis TaxID=99883 RepID=H3CX28_TETNG